MCVWGFKLSSAFGFILNFCHLLSWILSVHSCSNTRHPPPPPWLPPQVMKTECLLEAPECRCPCSSFWPHLTPFL